VYRALQVVYRGYTDEEEVEMLFALNFELYEFIRCGIRYTVLFNVVYTVHTSIHLTTGYW
jgi:hypothetical protein